MRTGQRDPDKSSKEKWERKRRRDSGCFSNSDSDNSKDERDEATKLRRHSHSGENAINYAADEEEKSEPMKQARSRH